jgi:hypothetical protein
MAHLQEKEGEDVSEAAYPIGAEEYRISETEQRMHFCVCGTRH